MWHGLRTLSPGAALPIRKRSEAMEEEVMVEEVTVEAARVEAASEGAEASHARPATSR